MTAGFEDDVFPQQQITKIAYVVEPTRSPDITIQTEESTDQQVNMYFVKWWFANLNSQKQNDEKNLFWKKIKFRSTKSLTFVYLEQK